MELPKFIRPRKPPAQVFIRLGRWSPRSYNHHTGEQEKGVSVYPARMQADGTVAIDDGWYLYPEANDRLVFAVTGKVVGIGSDGEPVLQAVKCLAYPIDFHSMPPGDWWHCNQRRKE